MISTSYPCAFLSLRIQSVLRTVAVLSLIFFSGAHDVLAATVTVMWARNPESTVVGYIVSYGTQSGVYTTRIDVGNVTSQPVTLVGGQRYYFVVQAYDSLSRVSPMSTEVAADVYDSTPPVINTLSTTTGAAGTAVTISGANFGATQLSSIVQFNGIVATPSSWSNTSIVVPVPAGATSGPVVVTVNAVASNSATFTVSTASAPLTGPWTDQDVGAPVVAGNASVTGGTFTVTGAGTDIWDVNDQFHFMYQPLTGDGQIVARVASLQNTDAWAKAGVMIRAALTGGSVNAVAQVTAGNGMTFQQRSTTGGTSTFVQGPGGAAPQWVRLVRSGNTVTGYTSVDGTTWTMLSSTTLALPTQVFIGLSVTSHNLGVATTATFTNVTVTQP